MGGPRSRKQLENARYRRKKQLEFEERGLGKKANFADHIQNIETMTKTEGDFVRSVHVTANKIPTIVLYCDDQMKDIIRCCCSWPLAKSTILGVDKTFNLTDLHVTPLVFKNIAVKRRTTGDNPIFLGPILIHGNSDFETFHVFFSELSAVWRKTTSSPVFGFDDETALHGALLHVFHSSSELYCTKHLKDNVIAYMQNKAGVKQKVKLDSKTKIYLL